uniref:Uncharacterized protein n=1 Tax=Roseihalotalea indica TaxID=2867963 RepID=A0AA49GJP2_9BACT|nr:hypothetical protein K4G66_27315 [Tunicatimonas sp. TK19036]
MANIKITGLLLAFLLLSILTYAQIPVDLSDFDQKGEATATLKDSVLDVIWPTGETEQGRLLVDLHSENPLLKSIQLTRDQNFQEVAANLEPAFLLTIGKRDLAKRDGWVIFFDNPAHLPHETHQLQLSKQSVTVTSEGARTHIVVDGAEAGPFSGALEFTLFNGSPLMKVEAVVSSEQDSLAILYDAGMVAQQSPWEKVWWANPEGYLQDTIVSDQAKSQAVAVKYRTIIGQSDKGSMAVFPSPHQYFYPLDNAYNLQHTWFGNDYRSMLPGFGIGIRHEPLGDRRWVPWFNAPPSTQQRLSFFCLLSTEKDGKVLEEVKKFTHSDSYESLSGYYTMSSHFHTEHTDDVLTHKPLPDIPGFVKAFRNIGVNIVHLGEFHGPGSPRGPEIKRFSELKLLFEECERLSTGDFLLLPGEEPNNFLGGHWMNIFPEPVYWVMSREQDMPYREEHPQYGTVYRIGSAEDMLQLLEDEKGLAWTAHARIKGSTGFPDEYQEEDFFHSDRFFGAAWKAMPADLSQPRLGKRVLDVMDDMANWGEKKHVIAEADLFKIEPDYELYGHMNVNYLQMEELPEFTDGWQPVLDAMQQGKFFVTTGEILLPRFTVNGSTSGETLALDRSGEATVEVDIRWTFPLQFAEIISGDGQQVYRETIDLQDTPAFGEKTFTFPVTLKNRKWVRLEVWDAATNGAFTQMVWLE